MEFISLGIYSKDSAYGKALGEALGACCRNILVTVIEDGKTSNDLSRGIFDLILCEAEIVPDWLSTDKVVLLVEKGHASENWETPGKFKLYKYQNILRLSQKLLFAYWTLTGRKIMGFDRCGSEILFFWSAEGGCGCTTAAMAAAGYLKRYSGKKALYLSLESIESTSLYVRAEEHINSLEAYLYYLLEKKAGCPPMDTFLMETQIGVSVFKPTSGGRNPLLTLKEEHVPLFFNAVAAEFDYLVVDGGSSLEFISLWALENCSRAYFVAAREEVERKEAVFCDYATSNLGDGWQEKMVHLRNRQPYGPGDVHGGALIIHEDVDSLTIRDGFRHIDMDRDLGSEIGEVLLNLT